MTAIATTRRSQGAAIAQGAQTEALRSLEDLEKLGSLLASAGAAVASLELDDPSWPSVGPHLTAAVDAARRAMGDHGSPIAPAEIVAPVVRLRDLSRAAQRLPGMSEGKGVPAGALREVTDRVQSLHTATGR